MKKFIIFSLTGLLLAGCVNMDIPKKNTITEETLMSSTSGMDKYIARMYAQMPWEDFKYQARWGLRNNGWLGAFGIEGTGEAVSREGLSTSFTREETVYWNDKDQAGARPFVLLRDANVIIANFNKYEANFTPIDYNNYLGQAYFVRATVFYAMAKRYGGTPLITHPIDFVNDEEIDFPRSSEEETWDQILADFDMAISLLAENSADITLANKYVALAYKAEAMNYAGSVAKYNSEYGLALNSLPPGQRTGVRVIGFANGQDASKRYFTEAYKAASEVIQSGRYRLYMGKWQANNPEAQYQNLVTMFSGEDDALLRSNPENMLAREYLYPTSVHVLDAFSGPAQFRTTGVPLSGGTCPTLDFVELFDGLPRNAEGRIKVTTGNTNYEGNYLQFDSPMDIFKDAEPRLRAYVLLPNDIFKGQTIEVRTGTYTGPETDIALLGNNNGGYAYSNATKEYPTYTQTQGGDNRTLWLGGNWDTVYNTMVEYDGGNSNIPLRDGKMTASGLSGPFHNNSECTLTGFYLRKWLNPDPAFIPGENAGSNADQPFIMMRYADVLLAAAEAAVELSIAGASSPDGTDMLAVATTAIKDIQTRAGANVISANLTGNNASRDIVRKERRKELAFEHKTKWDLRRWRVLHRQGRDGFWGVESDASKFSDGSADQFRFRGLYPFFSTTTGKFFFDDRFQYRSLRTYNYNTAGLDYYFEIPQDQVNKSMLLDQQPNRL